MSDRFLIEQSDSIDNAVFDAISSIADDEIKWDMELIGEVVDFIEMLLNERDIPACRPWYFDSEYEVPCYASEERCPHCKVS